MSQVPPVVGRTWTERYAVFQMSDGSPSFRERQYNNESLDVFVQRMKQIEATGGGYISLVGWHRHEVSHDREAAALAAHSGENLQPNAASAGGRTDERDV
jgi:hypothetical protein